MGTRDYRSREQKKDKKDKKKSAPSVSLIRPAGEPEVAVKRKPAREDDA
jgi:hypothetical protein